MIQVRPNRVPKVVKEGKTVYKDCFYKLMSNISIEEWEIMLRWIRKRKNRKHQEFYDVMEGRKPIQD